jgi:hypothetical protein
MKNNSINFITTIIFALFLSRFLPWWSVMAAAFVTSFVFSLKKSAIFLVPFFAIALYWGAYSFWLSSSNDFILAKKIAVLLPLQGNAWLLVLVTGVIGGVAAGISAVFGKQCRVLLGI